MLDHTKKAFISITCDEAQYLKQYILKVLEKYKIERSNMIEGIHMRLASDGDYIVRCFEKKIAILQIKLLSPTSYETRVVCFLT